MARSRVPLETLVESYSRLQSVSAVGKEVGLNHSSVHERLRKAGVCNSVNLWLPEHDAILKDCYQAYADAGRLKVLAERLGRTVPFLSRQAKNLGLTNQKRPKTNLRKWEAIDRGTARKLFDAWIKSGKTMAKFSDMRGFAKNGLMALFDYHFSNEYAVQVEKIKGKKNWRYAAGRRFEYVVRDHLEALGAFVMRSPGSKSPVDILAVHNGRPLFVQVKAGAWHEVDAWNELIDLASSHGATPIFATKKDGPLKLYVMDVKKDGSRRPVEVPEWTP